MFALPYRGTAEGNGFSLALGELRATVMLLWAGPRAVHAGPALNSISREQSHRRAGPPWPLPWRSWNGLTPGARST